MVEPLTTSGKKTNFHSIADLAKSHKSTTEFLLTNDDKDSVDASLQPYKVKMEPSPAQSLVSALFTPHACNQGTHGYGSCDLANNNAPSPTNSEDSGYGRDYITTLGIPYSDEDPSVRHADEEARADRLRKVRKQRTVFETTQLERLESTFNVNPYPSSEDYEILSTKIDIDEARLRIWFQNRRARHRRSSKNVPSSVLPVPPFPVTGFASHHAGLPTPQLPPHQLMMFGAHPLLFGGF